jgi:hypothetical protein
VRDAVVHQQEAVDGMIHRRHRLDGHVVGTGQDHALGREQFRRV